MTHEEKVHVIDYVNRIRNYHDLKKICKFMSEA